MINAILGVPENEIPEEVRKELEKHMNGNKTGMIDISTLSEKSRNWINGMKEHSKPIDDEAIINHMKDKYREVEKGVNLLTEGITGGKLKMIFDNNKEVAEIMDSLYDACAKYCREYNKASILD